MIIQQTPQIIKDFGGTIHQYPAGKFQAGIISIVKASGTALTTAVSNVTVNNTSIATTLNATEAAGSTSLVLTSTSGMKAWQTLQLGPNTKGQSEFVVIRSIDSSTGITIADPEGILHAYAADDPARINKVSYDITTDVAEAESLGEAYRAEWQLVIGENNCTASAVGTTTTINVLDADATKAIVGMSVVVYLGTTFYYEQRTITAVSSAAGTTTVTVDKAFSEATALADNVYFDAELHIKQQLFDIVKQKFEPTLNPDRINAYWPDLRDEQFRNLLTSEYRLQIDLAWELLLQDLRANDKYPYLFVGENYIFEEAHVRKLFILLAEAGVCPNWVSSGDMVEYIEMLEQRYSKALSRAIRISKWYDINQDLQLTDAETHLGQEIVMYR